MMGINCLAIACIAIAMPERISAPNLLISMGKTIFCGNILFLEEGLSLYVFVK